MDKKLITHKFLEQKYKNKKYFERISCDCFVYGGHFPFGEFVVMFMGKEIFKREGNFFFNNHIKTSDSIIFIENGSNEIRIDKEKRNIECYRVFWRKAEDSNMYSIKDYELICSTPFDYYGL